MSPNIPLYHFFTTLRGHKDFSLGLAEYFSLIEVFQRDKKYQDNAQQLLNLCRFLWLKPGQSENLFVSLFRQSFDGDNSSDLEEEESKKNKLEDKFDNKTQEEDVETDEDKNLDESEEENKNEIDNNRGTEDLYLNIINKNVGKSVKTTTEENLVAPYKIHLLDKHIVLKERQLKQRWRTLKKIVDGNIGNEIDILATIRQVGETGFLLNPVFQKEKKNAANLITLVDNQGSMVAFKGLTNALIQTASKGAKIDTNVFYFKNLPKINKDETDFNIYRTPAYTSFSGLIKELQHQLYKKKDIAILIISDAGAARGNLNIDRLNETVQLLQVIKHFSFKIVWLNPVPEDRWIGTSAALIKDFVPMFTANENGLKEAIEILRGKITANTRLFYEEMILE